MGGKTAMQFLHDHSEIVDKAIIVDIAPKSYVGNHEIILEALLSVDFSKMESRKQVQEILEEKIKEPGVVQFLLKNLHRNGGLGYKWKANVEALNNNYENILAGIEAEHVIDNDVLFVKAGKSDYIQEIDFSLINELFPNNQIKEIKNAGHWVHADSKEVLLDMVQDFLLNEK
jgi:pimeloyl-ACP methyl ester carboxylesterase